MKKSSKVNIGGVNGLGESLVNTNSQSFRTLKDMITAHSSNQNAATKLENKMISLRFQMETYLGDEMSGKVIPAGSFIEKFLDIAGISKKKFSDYIQYDYSNLIATMKGRRKVNPDLAIKTGEIFGINPSILLHIETKNDLKNYLQGAPEQNHFSLAGLLK